MFHWVARVSYILLLGSDSFLIKKTYAYIASLNAYILYNLSFSEYTRSSITTYWNITLIRALYRTKKLITRFFRKLETIYFSLKDQLGHQHQFLSIANKVIFLSNSIVWGIPLLRQKCRVSLMSMVSTSNLTLQSCENSHSVLLL